MGGSALGGAPPDHTIDIEADQTRVPVSGRAGGPISNPSDLGPSQASAAAAQKPTTHRVSARPRATFAAFLRYHESETSLKDSLFHDRNWAALGAAIDGHRTHSNEFIQTSRPVSEYLAKAQEPPVVESGVRSWAK